MRNFIQSRHLQDSLFWKLPQSSSEGWVSGLNQYIANVPYAKVYRGFESLPLRHTYILLHPTTSSKSLLSCIQTGKA